MQEVEIDVVDGQPAQRRVARARRIRGGVVDAPLALLAHDAELGGEHDLFATVGDGGPDELLVGVGPVGVRRVEQRDPEVQRAVDRRDRLLVVGGSVELRHAHAAEPQRGHRRAVAAQRAFVHRGIVHPRRFLV
jgi:hypothetical protein